MAQQFLLYQHNKLEQMVNNIIFFSQQDPEFQSSTHHKNFIFYPQSPHVPQHEPYPFVIQHNNQGQTYSPILSIATFYVSHNNRTSNSLDKISTFYFDWTRYNIGHIVLILSLLTQNQMF
jgi:hypothetical protein